MVSQSEFDDDDRSSCGSDSFSVDTNVALSEMLGLPYSYFLDGLSSSHPDDDDGGPDRHRDDDDYDYDHDHDHERCESISPSLFDGVEAIGEGVRALEMTTLSPPPRPPPTGPSSPRVSFLDVPRRCSRYRHHPSDVTAFVVHDLFDAEECRSIIRLASSSSSSSSSSSGIVPSSGFGYVTEAAHADDDGNVHVVKLADGANHHKLSVFEHGPTVDALWTKLGRSVLPHIESFVRHVQSGPPLGLNPRLRVLRYDANDDDVFDPHFDATTRVTVGKREEEMEEYDENDDEDDVPVRGKTTLSSLLTVLIYLNDGGGVDFDGGETHFIDHDYGDSASSRHRHYRGVGGGTDATSTRITPERGKVVVFEHDLYHMSGPLIFGTKYVLRTDVLFNVKSTDGVGRRRRRRRRRRLGGSSLPENDDELANTTTTTTTTTTPTTPRTLIDACRWLSLAVEDVRVLDEIGLLDSTLDNLLAPGVHAIREVLRDVVDGRTAEGLIQAALESRRDDVGRNIII
ncbi:hypothetical protein ACHAXA_003508 [Cyclostephanos tholiformis]|uniref:Fe2OG dioxygenase domain-containing protein n=1 Tax=Cyclostephanos tholiformis TaxID=382380 RepID=A0ABD3SFC9_9STRA